jgi:hypothetical protein
VVDPTGAGWVRTVAWDQLLTPSGTLAVITYSDTRRGRLADPTSEVAYAAQRTGLALLDQVVLLETPIHASRLAADPARHDDPPPAGPAEGVPHRVHSQLLLFDVVLPAAAGRTRDASKPGPARPAVAG